MEPSLTAGRRDMKDRTRSAMSTREHIDPLPTSFSSHLLIIIATAGELDDEGGFAVQQSVQQEIPGPIPHVIKMALDWASSQSLSPRPSLPGPLSFNPSQQLRSPPLPPPTTPYTRPNYPSTRVAPCDKRLYPLKAPRPPRR